MEPVQVVPAPPMAFVYAPRTSSVLPEESVKLVPEVSENAPVVVALSVMVHPPPEALSVRFANDEVPGLMVSPVSVEFMRTVPLLCVNVPLLVKEPATASVPDGKVTAPFTIEKCEVVVALLPKVHSPPTPSNVTRESTEEPGVISLPEEEANILSVDPLWLKVPPDALNEPPIAKMFAGAVVEPTAIEKLFVVVANVSTNVHAPPEPFNVRL